MVRFSLAISDEYLSQHNYLVTHHKLRNEKVTKLYKCKEGKVIPLQARCGPEGGYSSMTAALERG